MNFPRRKETALSYSCFLWNRTISSEKTLLQAVNKVHWLVEIETALSYFCFLWNRTISSEKTLLQAVNEVYWLVTTL